MPNRPGPETETMQPAPLPAGRGSVIATFVPGELIGDRFRIVRLLGQGGMGQVFEARDLELDEPVALKVIRPEISRRPRSIERFKREVRLARQVTHENVCRVFDLFQVKSRHRSWGKGSPPILFLTMELLAGETLAERLRRGPPLSPRRALPLIQGMANALDAAHRAGIVHRDFKTSNVLLTGGEADPRVVVTDFGLAETRWLGQVSTRHRVSKPFGGTPAYAAPELTAGEEATAAADIYSLGVVIHEMCTGALPGRVAAPQTTGRAVADPASRQPELAGAWEAAVRRCLDPRPDRRFARASDVPEALVAE